MTGVGDFVATAPSVFGPLGQPSDSGLPVATPLSSSCHRGSLGSSYSVKLLPQLAPWSRPLSCGLPRSNSRLPKLYTYCTLLQRMRVVFPLFVCVYHSGTLIGHKHSQEQLIYRHTRSTSTSQVSFSLQIN